MKILIPKSKVPAAEAAIRHCGYGQIVDRRENKISYARRAAGGALYPRFHVYLEDAGDNWSFNLHLDQRAPVYAGQTAHAGEYDGVVVEQEGVRIKNLLLK